MSHETHHQRVENHHEAPKNHENDIRQHEVEKTRHERAERANDNHEHAATEARHSVRQEAISGEERYSAHTENLSPPPIRTREDRITSFNTTMSHVRANLSKPEKTLSKFIHQPVVEKVSEVAAKTIARPSGIIGGTIAAFIGLLSVYGVAKFAGFTLSGSEMPLLLLAGFVAGLIIEWVLKATRALFSAKAR